MNTYRLTPQQQRCMALSGARQALSYSYIDILLKEHIDVAAVEEMLIEAIRELPVLRLQFGEMQQNPNTASAPQGDARLLVRYVDAESSLQYSAANTYESQIHERIKEDLTAEQDYSLILYVIAHDAGLHRMCMAVRACIGDINSLKQLVSYVINQQKLSAITEVDYLNLSDWLWQGIEDQSVQQRKYWQDHISDKSFGIGKVKATSISPAVFNFESLPEEGILQAVPDNATFVSAFALLLAQREANESVTIGYEIAGRDYDELQAVVGPLSKQLPLYIKLDKAEEFTTVKQKTNEKIVELTENSEYFDWDLCGGEKDSAMRYGISIYETGVNLNHKFIKSHVCFTTGHANILQLVVVNSADRQQLLFIYDEESYSVPVIRFMARQLIHILYQVAQKPHVLVNGISPMNEALENEVLLQGRGHSSVIEPVNIVDIIDALAHKNASGVALVNVAGEKLSYRQFVTATNKLANFLVEEGVEAGQRVGICLPRSLDMIVSMIGVIKAGCSFVPMDPGYPYSRIQAIMDGSGLVAVITKSEWIDLISEATDEICIVDLNRDRIYVDQCSEMRPDIVSHQQQEVYSIFTSGSTGKPKGVSVCHSSLVNYVEALQACVDLSEVSSMTALSTVAADLGYTAVFGALASGRVLRIIDEEKSLDAPALAAELQSVPVDCLKIVPSHLKALLSVEAPIRVLPKQVLILGGEKLDADLLAAIRAINPVLRIYNHYGPTETTIGVAVNRVGDDYCKKDSPIALGYAIRNTRFYVLQNNLQLCGLGAEGELYIAGASLANGYCNNPAQSAVAFIPDPFSDKPGTRMYRTGDRVIMRDDGSLVFKGRADQQLKLRGFRIELEEIENVIQAMDNIEAVVVKLYSEDGSDKLVAYFSGPNHDCSADIVAALTQKLPVYMIPACWIWISKMPLNANGKIDRSALPDPKIVTKNTDFEENNILETALLKLLGKVLGIESLSKHDNFFTVGGDSITAIRFVAQARQEGFILKPREIFDNPTIEELAKLVKSDEAPQRDQLNITGASLLAPIQSRFFERVLADAHHYNQAIILQSQSCFTKEHLSQSIYQLMQHHDVLRSTFTISGGDKPVPEYHELSPTFVDSACEVIVWGTYESTHGNKEERIQKLVAEKQASFDLEKGPLIRFVSVYDGEEQLLLIFAHHLIIDVYSWQILEEDLAALLDAAISGRQVELPAKSYAYHEWAERIQHGIENKIFAAELPYWISQFPSNDASEIFNNASEIYSGASGIHNMQSNLVSSAATELLRLDKITSAALTSDIHETFNTTITDLVLTAFLKAFEYLTGYNSLHLMMESHGRDNSLIDVDVSRTVGWFTSMYPLYLEVDGNLADADLIKYVKERVRQTPNDGLGYGVLRYGQACPELFRSEPSVCFNYFGKMLNKTKSSGILSASDYNWFAQENTRAHSQPRLFQIEIVGLETEDGLVFNIIYNEMLISAMKIQEFTQIFTQSILTLIDTCRYSSGAFTPSDLADLDMDQADIDALINKKLQHLFA